MVKVDLRKSSARLALAYTHKANFYALPVKGSCETHFLILSGEALEATIRDKSLSSAFQWSADCLRWKGLQANKAHVKGLTARVVVRKTWKDFEVKDGNRSADIENTVCEALNKTHFLASAWRVCSDENWEGYTPDLVSDTGITIEVKGFNGRLFG